MNNIEIICDILTSISTLFTAIICYVTCKTYNAQFKQIRKQSLPNLQILSIKYSKSNPNDTNLSNGRHCRIKRGSTKADINISNNIASFEYVYQNFEIAMIYERINSIADSTAKVFYILKYIYKNNFYNSSYIDEVKDICMFLIENATINFDCIKNMIMHFNSGNNLITNLNDDTRNAFLKEQRLLDLIEEKSNSFKLFESIYDKLNDAIVQSKESIAKEINQFN